MTFTLFVSAQHLTGFFIDKQIDKLLKLANATERVTAENDEDDDPLRFGPNPGALVSKTGEDEEGGDGMYRPPKMLPTSMDFETGGKDAKELRRNKEQRRRAGRSQLIKVRAYSRVGSQTRFLRALRSRPNANLPPGSLSMRQSGASLSIWRISNVPNLGQGATSFAVGEHPIKSWIFIVVVIRVLTFTCSFLHIT